MKSLITILSAGLLVLGGASVLANEATKDDTALIQETKDKITKDTNVPTATVPTVVVDSTKGKVKVIGIVNSKTQKKDIEKAAKSINGSKDVDVDITVKD